MSIQKITKQTSLDEVINSSQTVLIDFYADWCGPCNMLSPILEEISQEETSAKILKVNVDEERDLALRFDVMSIPTLVVFKNGQPVSRLVGLQSKSTILNRLS